MKYYYYLKNWEVEKIHEEAEDRDNPRYARGLSWLADHDGQLPRSFGP